jgi:hypothetical protein
MRERLAQAERLQAKYAEIFRPQVAQDEGLRKRLDAYGPFRVDLAKTTTTLFWSAPVGLESDWTQFTLAIAAPTGDETALAVLLDACDRLRKRFSACQADIRAQVLDSFAMARPWMHDWQLDDYERDDEGNPTEASILREAGAPSISVSLPGWPDDDTVLIEGYVSIEWDPEHGLELAIEDEPEPLPVEARTIPSELTFQDVGPKLTPAAIMKFEAEQGVELPPEHREFLLQVNGGCPQPSFLNLRIHGEAMPVDVVRFYGIGASDLTADLGFAIAAHRERRLPSDYLPIGLASSAGAFGQTAEHPLYLATGGRRAGKIVINLAPSAGVFPVQALAAAVPQSDAILARMFDLSCQTAASGAFTLLGQLAAAGRGKKE